MKLDFFSITWVLASVVATVVLHSVGTVLIVVERPRRFNFASHQRKLLRGQFVMTIVVTELLLLHLIEVGVWGLCLDALRLFSGLGSALYFAGISYTSLGYSGPSLSPRLGFFEVLISMMGLLMFGWSIGILVTTVIRYERVSLGWDPTNDQPVEPGE